ncbi:hypothetical protein ARAM_007626 [Aspergillus rambellii]|uniref:Uncharacterized protein n=1 Tax=Aspergillus rambellii TaxID=308745 RepID=A0A0F8WW16_9EURO|nr:hypothetical protein ARAM_007626 [Aspergillus rambellii]
MSPPAQKGFEGEVEGDGDPGPEDIQVSLLEYLQLALPEHSMGPPDVNEVDNPPYKVSDIHTISTWTEFNVDAILAQYASLLNQVQLRADPLPASPPRSIIGTDSLSMEFGEIVKPRIQCSLRAGFAYLAATEQMDDMTAVTIEREAHDMYDEAVHWPEISFLDVDMVASSASNRAPGVLLPSWRWRTGMAMRTPDREAYLEGLARVNWYMRQHGASFGWILTDEGLVAVQRGKDAGELLISEEVPWCRGGTPEMPEVTVLLGLWYVGMLSARDP